MIKNQKLVLLIVFEVFLILLLFFFAFINRKYFLPCEKDEIPRVIVIKPGTSIYQAATILADSGIICSVNDFIDYARLFRRGEDIKYGIYNFEQPVSVSKAFAVLNEGSSQLVKVTFPEGIKIVDVAEILHEKLGKDDKEIIALSHNRSFCDSLGVKSGSLEGFLLPETYLFDPLTSEKSILVTMVKKSLEIYEKNKDQIARSGRTVQQIATMASLVEGECQLDDERPVVASVYYNRLIKNMPLQADPTIQYILKGKPRRLRNRDLKIDSPYNTYKYKGLPPGPINNPGKKSILAAIYPDTTNYLYFVARGDGGHYFAATYKEHLKNKKRFDQVRREVFYEKRKKRGH